MQLLKLGYSLEKLAVWVGKVLVLGFFAALILMGSVFPLFGEAQIALPVSVNVVNQPSDLKITQVIYDNAVLVEKPMRGVGVNSWQGDSKTWLMGIKIHLAQNQQPDLKGLNIKIGSQTFKFTDADIMSEWTKTQNGSEFIFSSPPVLKSAYSRLGKFNGFINWPGDSKFIASAVIRLLLTIACILAVLGIMFLFNGRQRGWLTFVHRVRDYLNSRGFLGIGLVIILGLGLRLWVSSWGYSVDVRQHFDNGMIFLHGGNVYAETIAYNYGPIWFHVLGFLDTLARYNFMAFKWLFTIFLSLVDVGIFIVLMKKFSKTVAILFLLNPISIFITGYNRQFDNFAVLLGLLAVLVYGENFARGFNARKIAGLILLGLSIITKHIFFAFPFWLAIKQKGWKEKIVVLCGPVLMFFASFLPYVKTGKEGIIHNVFLYQGLGGTAVLRLAKLLLGEAHGALLASLFMLLALGVFGIIFKKYAGLKSLLVYGLVLILFTASISGNYLSIAAPGAAVFVNGFFVWFFLSAGFLLASGTLKLSNWPTSGLLGFFVPTLFLFLGFLRLTAKDFFPKLTQGRLGRFLGFPSGQQTLNL